MKRRRFLKDAAACAATLTATSSVLAAESNAKHAAQSTPAKLGQAEHCIMIWLGGGMAQIDTFDPKEVGDAKARKAGSYYPAIDTAVPGVQVCQHLSRTAKMMEHVTALRTVGHDVVDEHAAATNRMHTGRPTSGTVQYPSLGSIVADQRGAAAEGVPAYMLIGYPNLTRGPGFLGQKAGFVYLTDVESGPAGLARPAGIDMQRQSRREQLLAAVRDTGRTRFGGDEVYRQYDQAVSESLRLSGPDFMKAFELENEPGTLRDEYGDGFGQRCLLARRLFQSGVRFVEVSHNMNFRNGTGWDTHNDGQLNQHLLIEELDQSLTAMMTDLQSVGLLDKTLIVINSEFGRPAQFDSGGGRGHHSKCFSAVLAGGGLSHCGAWGVTDELAMSAEQDPVSVPDMFATILAAMGIDPSINLFDGDRPVPIVDGGKPIEALLG
ncbi:DUF1501 domain-containing protein [Stieleria varia]|uniref:Sulfatase n=1 Tax=Stieleria varia TaxID=2528005 RepID=A0A5C6B6U6_9BACT|nr:DUF1501 domain-containing protein [Stieleria varia]TWU07487.1 hypothetical protein Pla52n_00600 [Stieleria varia]